MQNTRNCLFPITLFTPIAFATDNAALDHEGWAVGVAALWGYFINFDDYNDTISATYNTVIVTNSIFSRGTLSGDWRPSVHD